MSREGWKQWAVNLRRDALARLRGRCNRAPAYMTEGGYHFWRCGLPRGHDGPCRFGNYLWGSGGSVYAPVNFREVGLRIAERYPVQTFRQKRQRRRYEELSDVRRIRRCVMSESVSSVDVILAGLEERARQEPYRGCVSLLDAEAAVAAAFAAALAAASPDPPDEEATDG